MPEDFILNAAGHSTAVWSWKPAEGQHIGPDALFSGIGPGTVREFSRAISRYGHAITQCSLDRPWNHHVAGVGVGHDDAEFAESGTSHAAYLESGEAFGGKWWESESGRRQYGITDETCCYACGKRGTVIPDRGRRYCESCLFADMDREAAEIVADSPVTVKAR